MESCKEQGMIGRIWSPKHPHPTPQNLSIMLPTQKRGIKVAGQMTLRWGTIPEGQHAQ